MKKCCGKFARDGFFVNKLDPRAMASSWNNLILLSYVTLLPSIRPRSHSQIVYRGIHGSRSHQFSWNEPSYHNQRSCVDLCPTCAHCHDDNCSKRTDAYQHWACLSLIGTLSVVAAKCGSLCGHALFLWLKPIQTSIKSRYCPFCEVNISL